MTEKNKKVIVKSNIYFDSIYNFSNEYKEFVSNEELSPQTPEDNIHIIENITNDEYQKICQFGSLGALRSSDKKEMIKANYFLTQNLDTYTNQTLNIIKINIKNELNNSFKQQEDLLIKDIWIKLSNQINGKLADQKIDKIIQTLRK